MTCSISPLIFDRYSFAPSWFFVRIVSSVPKISNEDLKKNKNSLPRALRPQTVHRFSKVWLGKNRLKPRKTAPIRPSAWLGSRIALWKESDSSCCAPRPIQLQSHTNPPAPAGARNATRRRHESSQVSSVESGSWCIVGTDLSGVGELRAMTKKSAEDNLDKRRLGAQDCTRM